MAHKQARTHFLPHVNISARLLSLTIMLLSSTSPLSIPTIQDKGYACCRGFYSSAALLADSMAEKAQKKAGNPYAPTDSAGGTPTDNQADESMALPSSQVLHHHSTLLRPVALHISLLLHSQAFCPAWFDPYTACCAQTDSAFCLSDDQHCTLICCCYTSQITHTVVVTTGSTARVDVIHDETIICICNKPDSWTGYCSCILVMFIVDVTT